MRTLRISLENGARDLRIRDAESGVEVPDVLRIEFTPLNRGDAHLFGVVFVHRRDALGQHLHSPDGLPLSDKMYVRLVVGTVWEV